MKSSYSTNDVIVLLKDITGLVQPLPSLEREKNIQNGIHYCEMLPLEYSPSKEYMEAYKQALKNFSKSTAISVGILAEKIYQKHGNDIVIVSLARAGIPIGILIKRYLNQKYHLNIKHYTISIIRGRGIDKNAINHIISNHSPSSIQFIDGWIGKGAILNQLKIALKDYPELDAEIGVVSDPAGLSKLCGTHEDILIPSSCLNATVTGLLSRTFLRNDIIGENDFHGAAYYSNLADFDLSNDFIDIIQSNFDFNCINFKNEYTGPNGLKIVEQISKTYNITDINLIKPGIGETTRVLLRRVPWKILINSNFKNAPELQHIFQLANEKEVPYEISCVPLGNYKVCGIIKQIADL